jgi:hypothetical protein
LYGVTLTLGFEIKSVTLHVHHASRLLFIPRASLNPEVRLENQTFLTLKIEIRKASIPADYSASLLERFSNTWPSAYSQIPGDRVPIGRI